jgi:DNA-binding SARP family transcriptional activator
MRVLGGEAPQLALLGSFRLVRCREQVELPIPSQRVLAFLALARRPLLRSHVAGMLWPEASEERAHGSLRSALWRLQHAGAGLVVARSSQLAPAPGLQVDVGDLLEVSHAVLDDGIGTDPEAVVPRLARTLGGELLPDWYEDWVAVEREHLRQLRLHALESLADRLVGLGRYAAASEAALAAVAADPLRESAHRSLIRVYLAEGNAADAFRQYAFYRRLARDRLGLDPSELMEALLPARRARVHVTQR